MAGQACTLGPSKRKTRSKIKRIRPVSAREVTEIERTLEPSEDRMVACQDSREENADVSATHGIIPGNPQGNDQTYNHCTSEKLGDLLKKTLCKLNQFSSRRRSGTHIGSSISEYFAWCFLDVKIKSLHDSKHKACRLSLVLRESGPGCEVLSSPLTWDEWDFKMHVSTPNIALTGHVHNSTRLMEWKGHGEGREELLMFSKSQTKIRQK